jgi:GxxExxY protein
MLRIDSPLTAKEEEIVRETIRGGIEVHRVLGPGFREPIYHQAFRLELENRRLSFESEKAILVKYKNWSIPGQRLDLVVAGVVIVELKSVTRLKTIHKRQVVSYLRTTGLKVGLLMNFNSLRLVDGLVRVVRSQR